MGDSDLLLFNNQVQGTPASLSTAYGSASYSLIAAASAGIHTADGLSSGTGGPVNLGYSNTLFQDLMLLLDTVLVLQVDSIHQ